MSSGDASLAPKRENTVSPILFHLGGGGEGRREGGKEVEIMRRSERRKERKVGCRIDPGWRSEI